MLPPTGDEPTEVLVGAAAVSDGTGEFTREHRRRVSHRRYVMRRIGVSLAALAIVGGGVLLLVALLGDDDEGAGGTDTTTPVTSEAVIAASTTRASTTTAARGDDRSGRQRHDAGRGDVGGAVRRRSGNDRWPGRDGSA